MKLPESQTFVPYEISSRRLIEELSQSVGFNPAPTKYLRKTPKGYLIHTSFSWLQSIVGIAVPFFLILMLIGLCDSLIAESVVRDWSRQTVFLIRYAFGLSYVLLALSGLFIGTIRRVSYLDLTNHRVFIATSLLFFTRKHELMREDIDAIRFNRYIQEHTNPVDFLFYKPLKIGRDAGRRKWNELNEMSRSCTKPGDVGSYWSISIQTRNGKNIPLTLKMFSDSNAGYPKSNREKVNVEKHVRNAWILAFSLGVPLHFIAADWDAVIRSPEDVPVYTEQEIEELKMAQEVFRGKSKEIIMRRAVVHLISIVLLFAAFLCYVAFAYFHNNKPETQLALPIIIEIVLLFVFILIFGIVIIMKIREKKRRSSNRYINDQSFHKHKRGGD